MSPLPLPRTCFLRPTTTIPFSAPTSLVALVASFIISHIFLSHRDLNTVTAAIFQLEVLGTNLLVRPSTPWLLRLARLFRLLPLVMIATEVPRGRSSARSVDDAARDLETVGTYVEAQLAAGRPIGSVLATQADALNLRLQNLAAVDLQQGSILTLAVARGPWTDQQKESMSRTIDGLVASGRAAPQRRGLQHLPKPENTMLEVEWRSLRTSGPILGAKIAQVATRMWSIGLTCPSETTSVKFAGILCVCCNIADPHEQRDVFERLKAAVKALDDKRTYPHGHLLQYPPDMADWPEAMVEYAYDSERPIKVNMPELDIIMAGTLLRGRGATQKRKKKAFLRGLQSIKEDADECGVNLDIGSHRDMKNARALLDKHIGSAETVGAASAPAPASQAAPASAPPASNVGGAALARLASTSLSVFKPHLALPPPPDAINKEDGARTSPTAAEGDATAVERMMREARVAKGILRKHVTWRRRITGKRGILGKPAAATKTTAAAGREHRRSGKIVRARPAAPPPPRNGVPARPLGCSKCRYLPRGCAQCRRLSYRPRKAMK